jgi:hypothetical protein
MDEHEHYGPGQPMNAADVAAIIAERDRLRVVVERALDHVGVDEHVLRSLATGDLVALVGVLRQDCRDAMIENDRLRAAFDRIALDPAEYRHALGHIADCDHNCDQCRQLAWQALDGGVDAQERATDILAERDRLRAVVEAARMVLTVIDSTPVGQMIDGIEGHDEITLLRVRLDQLDGSADMGGDS